MNLGFSSSASRWRGIVLGAWAGGIAVLLIAGRYSLFIRARLWPLLLASLLIILCFLLAMIVRPARAGSGRISLATWVRGGMLLLPLIYMSNLLTGAAASGLNSFTLQQRTIGLSESSDSAPTAEDPNQPMNLGDLAKHVHFLLGKHVITDARVYRDDSLPKGEMAVYRFVVVCCAADAMPVEVVVNSPKTAAFKNDDWVRVGGVLQIEDQDGKQVPVIKADQVDPIPAPEEPYLSPYGF